MAYQKLPTPVPTFSIPDIIPIFPLPNVVFFPHTYLPLHIFEPRYREMVTDASKRGQCIGMALLKEGWEDHYDGNPSIFPLGCVGRLVNIQKLGDGRSNIILEGLHRYQVEEELLEDRYRRARITLRLSDPLDTLAESLRTTLKGVADKYLRARNAHELCKMLATPQLTDPLLVNCLSSTLDFTCLEKHFLLESETLHQQARRLIDLIQFKLHERHRTPGWG